MSYTPQIQLSKQTVVQRKRELPLLGKALVNVGDEVEANDVVLSAERPGEVVIVRLAEATGLDVVRVTEGLKVCVGSAVSPGELLCKAHYFGGLLSSEVVSPTAGVVEYFSETTAHLGIRQPARGLTISAYLSGKVVAVESGRSVTIESGAALVQGVFGVGGESTGTVFVLSTPANEQVDLETLEKHRSELPGAVIIGGATFTREALAYCGECRVSGIMTGSIDSATLTQFVGEELGVCITGDENVPFPLIVTEGFGYLPISNRVLEIVTPLHGQRASLCGKTQVRAGAIRPELIIPSRDLGSQEPMADAPLRGSLQAVSLQVGSQVRIIRGRYFGVFATVVALYQEPLEIETGAHVRVIEVQTSDQQKVIIPRANVELV